MGLDDLYLGAWIKNYNKRLMQNAVVLDLSNKVICNCAHKRKRNLTIISRYSKVPNKHNAIIKVEVGGFLGY